MARSREVTTYHTGHRGYAVLPRPDVLRPDDRLAWAENVWLGQGAGICVRRGGQTNISVGTDITAAGAVLYGCLPYGEQQTGSNLEEYTNQMGAFATGEVDYWYQTSTLVTTSGWTQLAVPSAVQTNHAYTLGPDNTFPAQCASVNSKVVFCTTKYCGDHTRLALYDMTTDTLRLAGFAVPAAPTAANTGSGSYANTLRYYRVRYTAQSNAGVTLRRSDPSDDVSITPSGSGAGVLVTRPALLSEDETHWELEVSLDNANWYLLTTVAVGTTTYTDSTDTATYSSGTVAEAPGERLAPGQCRTVVADRDRFVFGGRWWQHATDVAAERPYANRVWFTPVLGTTDIADEECVPSDNYIDVAPSHDHITALTLGPNDDILVFKERSVYRLLRTGVAAAPYEVVDLAEGIGTLGPEYVCVGVDANQAPCVYFADRTGYWRYGTDGFVRLDRDLHGGVIVPESRVVYYRRRRVVLFGRLAYHIETGGWSWMTWGDVLHEQQFVTPHWSTPSEDTEGDELWAPGRLEPTLRLLDSGTSDLDGDSVADPFVARVGLSRRLLSAGQRWAPTRCVLWGSGGARLEVHVARDEDPVTDYDTYDTDALEQVAVAMLPETSGTGSTQPVGLGVGSVVALGVWLEDPSTASTDWRLDAVEITGLPAEPLP